MKDGRWTDRRVGGQGRTGHGGSGQNRILGTGHAQCQRWKLGTYIKYFHLAVSIYLKWTHSADKRIHMYDCQRIMYSFSNNVRPIWASLSFIWLGTFLTFTGFRLPQCKNAKCQKRRRTWSVVCGRRFVGVAHKFHLSAQETRTGHTPIRQTAKTRPVLPQLQAVKSEM